MASGGGQLRWQPLSMGEPTIFHKSAPTGKISPSIGGGGTGGPDIQLGARSLCAATSGSGYEGHAVGKRPALTTARYVCCICQHPV